MPEHDNRIMVLCPHRYRLFNNPSLSEPDQTILVGAISLSSIQFHRSHYQTDPLDASLLRFREMQTQFCRS